MNQKPKVLHVLNTFNLSSGPGERALAINSDKFDVTICSYYSIEDDINFLLKDTKKKIISLDAKKKIDIKTWLKLKRLIKKESFDIIHTHHHLTGLIARVLNFFSSSSIKIHSFGNRYDSFSVLARLAHNLTFWLEDGMISVSRGVRKSFNKLEEFLIKDKSYIVYNGVDIEKIEHTKVDKQLEKKKLRNKADEFLIGSIGRLIPQKNQKTLIEAFARVKKSNSGVKLVIIGKGRLEEDLKQFATELGVLEDIIFTGYIERKKVYKILYSLDLFVMTSLWEGFSAVVLQAMATNNPLILTDIPSFREAINDGYSGRIVPIKNSEILAETMEEIINNPKVALNYAKNAKKTVKKNYTIEKTAQRYEELYYKLLE
ncbi:glycosyltransferase family 4 protein [Natroniella sulfidigena]|uniref:glycosyltransferase family 4 protein n=1 Tax=Natroniella sulfidigena TaxID=723921 RepID=UPI00200AC054|nr:glycosyltransferase family 4 protein [Natroniella sulfidigena]MCK8816303.1 glycosyltransferase family 4 protein [Natroniella sulfidigena]